MNQIKRIGILMGILIFFVFTFGCMQETRISGVYLSERDMNMNGEYIIFNNTNILQNTGNFTHINYNNTHNLVKVGTFKNNNNILILNYDDGKIIEYNITLKGQVLIPTSENSSFLKYDLMDDRFAKKVDCMC